MKKIFSAAVATVATVIIIGFGGIAIASHGNSSGSHGANDSGQHFKGDGHSSCTNNNSEHANHGTDAGEADHNVDHPKAK
jgi:hypothetical protein